MTVYFSLIVIHVIGAVLGVGGATFAEIFYTKALKDGEVDPHEGSMLRTVYVVLRIGLILTVLSGFGLLLLFRLTGAEDHLFDPKLWAKMVIVFILLINALLLTAHLIPMWLGASLSLTSWYAAMILGLWRRIPYDFVEIMIGYVIAVAIVALALVFIKRWYLSAPTRI